MDPELVAHWKRQYGQVYTASYRGVDYAFRELTLGEYEQALTIDTSTDGEDTLVNAALLSHQNVDEIPAGFVSALADQVLEVSGFGHPRVAKGMLEDERSSAEFIRVQMKAFVLAAMPSYKEEDLDTLTFRGLCKKLALAEQIIKVNQLAFAGQATGLLFDIEDPEEIAAKAAAEERAKKERQQRAWELLEKSGRIADDDDKGPPVAPPVKPEDPIAAKLRESLQ